MSIKQVLFPFTGSEMGGSHISAFTLARSLRDDFGVKPIVAAVRGSLIANEASASGFAVIELDEKPAMRHNLLFEAMKLPQRTCTLARLGSDTVLHTNDLAALQSWAPAAKLARMPVVYHLRALNRLNLPNRITLRFADHIIAISDFVVENIQSLRKIPRSRIDNPFTVTEPADRTAIRASLFAAQGMRDEGPLIGFVGNFWERKRPFYFLDAARALLLRRPDCRFAIFGRDGEYTAAALTERAAALGIADRVIMAGFKLPVEDNIAILDLLAITAEREPLGRTPIEAALLGVPYVGLDDGGIGEVARNFGGGRLVDIAADADQFADVCDAVLANPDAVRLTAQDIAALAITLSARTHAGKVVAIYEKLLNR